MRGECYTFEGQPQYVLDTELCLREDDESIIRCYTERGILFVFLFCFFVFVVNSTTEE